jgi:hypothetical protein
VQRWILARLRNRRFFSLAELNQAIRELPPPRTTLRADTSGSSSGASSCRHQRDADRALVDARHGDVPLINLRFRRSNCGSRLTEGVIILAAASSA